MLKKLKVQADTQSELHKRFIRFCGAAAAEIPRCFFTACLTAEVLSDGITLYFMRI